jgi:DNA-binding IclR family transcriptional regulator
LLSRGFVEKVDNDYYALGTAVIALTQAVRVNVELRDRAAPLLRELADTSHASVYLIAFDGDHGVYIYAIESPRRLLARTAVGDLVAFHCTSVGKAILACLPDKQIKSIVKRTGLPVFTPATITTLDRLWKDLEEARLRGYALDVEEHEQGIYCIGAPIFNERGCVIGACSISEADPEIVRGRLPDLASRVTYTAQETSRRMGYVPASPSLIAAPLGSNP